MSATPQETSTLPPERAPIRSALFVALGVGILSAMVPTLPLPPAVLFLPSFIAVVIIGVMPFIVAGGAAWHGTDHPKLVIAHIDIGEAEDYRTYWQPGWGIENPEWIAGHDPDDWEGNFPVAVPSIAMAASTITSSAAMASE